MATSGEDNWIRRFSVTDPFKHRKGFTLYKITSLVYPRKYPEAITRIVIWKRYNDFKKLHKELKVRFKKLHLTGDFPPFVKAKFFSRFESDVIEERRHATLKLLEFVAEHPPLFTSDAFVKFFESGYAVEGEDSSISSNLHPSNRCDPDTGQVVGQGSSDDDHTSFTTDTDSAISSPVQGPDVSLDDDTWSCPSQPLQTSLSQTTLSSLASVESLLLSFKNRFIGNSETTEARQKEMEVSKYWTESQKVVAVAEEKEKEGDYLSAFNSYKAAISQLLSGVQNDPDSDRRKQVKEKTAEFLNRAEFIANNFLSRDNASVKKKESEMVPLSQLWQPLSDLQWFKVVGVVGKVMLVIDTRTNYLFIVKALYKSAHPIYKDKCCIFPRRIPYMVELNSIFETDSSVFLVLQYVSGGKLWDYVSPFFQKPEETPVRVRHNSNPFTGRKCLEPDMVSVSTSDSCPSDLNLAVQECEVRSTLSSPGNSYLDLIRDYASNKHSHPVDNNCESTDSPVFKIVSETLTNNSGQEDSLPTLTSSCDHLYRDVLTLVNSDFTLNIEDTVDIDTKDLVEHAQRLLQSVDATLLESENVITRMGVDCEPTSHKSVTRLAVECDLTSNKPGNRLTVEGDSDVGSVSSGRSLDNTRLQPYINSKGSSPLSSVGPDAVPQWCQLDVDGAGIAEETVRHWASQILTAIDALHQVGIICLDLNPENLLVSGNTVRLTYFCSFPGVEPQLSTQARQLLYTAPELSSIFPVTPAADWWCLGTLLYQLLTGQSLSSYYPGGIFCHTILHVPDTISVEARSLLKELLRYDPNERLGSGLLGVEEIKSHPFFEGVQWDQIYSEGLLPI